MRFLIQTKFEMISCLVYRMLKNVIHCFPKPKMTSSSVCFFVYNPKIFYTHTKTNLYFYGTFSQLP